MTDAERIKYLTDALDRYEQQVRKLTTDVLMLHQKQMMKIVEGLALDVRVSHARYEYLRRLNVHQFAELYEENIKSGVAFDELVDRRIK